MQRILAKSVSYGARRDLSTVRYIVIHYTGNKNDTAVNNAKYYATTNTRSAGAHFFIDQSGEVVLSVEMGNVAWSVGGGKYADCDKTGGGTLYGIVTNGNSVSIELCDIVDKAPSDLMIKALADLIPEIRSSCPNAKDVVRHFDVTGKYCPARFMDNDLWNAFLAQIGEADEPDDKLPPKKFVALTNFLLRTSPNAGAKNRVDYDGLSKTLQNKCFSDDGGNAVFCIDQTFNRVRSRLDDHGNKWFQMQSGYWVPAIYNGKRRVRAV